METPLSKKRENNHDPLVDDSDLAIFSLAILTHNRIFIWNFRESILNE